MVDVGGDLVVQSWIRVLEYDITWNQVKFIALFATPLVLIQVCTQLACNRCRCNCLRHDIYRFPLCILILLKFQFEVVPSTQTSGVFALPEFPKFDLNSWCMRIHRVSKESLNNNHVMGVNANLCQE